MMIFQVVLVSVWVIGSCVGAAWILARIGVVRVEGITRESAITVATPRAPLVFGAMANTSASSIILSGTQISSVGAGRYRSSRGTVNLETAPA